MALPGRDLLVKVSLLTMILNALHTTMLMCMLTTSSSFTGDCGPQADTGVSAQAIAQAAIAK